MHVSQLSFFFFFNDTATTEIYTLSLHDALPISVSFSDGGDLEALSDADLVSNRLAAGGGGGSIWLQELFRRHYTKVVTWCLRVAGDREEAHDLAQGVFLKAQRYLGSFRGDSKVSTWLYSITRSECLNYLRSRSSLNDALDDDVAEALPDDPESRPENVFEFRSSVQAATPDHREIGRAHV